MIYFEIFMVVFYLLFLIYDIVHKEGPAAIINDAIWFVDIIYLIVISAKIFSVPILCAIDLLFVILWSVDYYIQNKYDTKVAPKWLPLIMTGLFSASFIMRIMTIIGG